VTSLVLFAVAWSSLSHVLVDGVAAKCAPPARMLSIDLDQSGIRWKGTKFWGLGSHEGTVQLTGREMCVLNGRIVGGTFVADMNTIVVTDIPESEPVPRRRLRDHLLSENFFHVSAHPEARLTLRSVEREERALHRVEADLTMRGRTRRVTFYARVWTLNNEEVSAEAVLKVDRHRWGVSYRGSTIRDDLVDDDFSLFLTVRAAPGVATM